MARIARHLFRRAGKLARLFSCPEYIQGLRMGVAAAVEHKPVLRQLNCRTVVDIGANRGQFALVARQCFLYATIFSFEPLSGPASYLRRVFARDPQVTLCEAGIGPKNGVETIHVSRRDDSSSFLAISGLQEQVFPGTAEVAQQTVEIGPLRNYVLPEHIAPPALLKLDVQGYEVEALKGCADLLGQFTYVYVECSFMELYVGQASADEVISFLRERGFVLKGVYNTAYDRAGVAVQADFLFEKLTG